MGLVSFGLVCVYIAWLDRNSLCGQARKVCHSFLVFHKEGRYGIVWDWHHDLSYDLTLVWYSRAIISSWSGFLFARVSLVHPTYILLFPLLIPPWSYSSHVTSPLDGLPNPLPNWFVLMLCDNFLVPSGCFACEANHTTNTTYLCILMNLLILHKTLSHCWLGGLHNCIKIINLRERSSIIGMGSKPSNILQLESHEYEEDRLVSAPPSPSLLYLCRNNKYI